MVAIIDKPNLSLLRRRPYVCPPRFDIGSIDDEEVRESALSNSMANNGDDDGGGHAPPMPLAATSSGALPVR